MTEIDTRFGTFIRCYISFSEDYMREPVPPGYKDIVDVCVELDGVKYQMTFDEFKSAIKNRS